MNSKIGRHRVEWGAGVGVQGTDGAFGYRAGALFNSFKSSFTLVKYYNQFHAFMKADTRFSASHRLTRTDVVSIPRCRTSSVLLSPWYEWLS